MGRSFNKQEELQNASNGLQQDNGIARVDDTIVSTMSYDGYAENMADPTVESGLLYGADEFSFDIDEDDTFETGGKKKKGHH
jgi:hypothetical protein